ncbi:chromosome segregation protein SMC [Corynebacterium uterequi]|uniref:Chromosome partition protein Smc n=1 Tax=Corynebacterium uterequi TaxID=1072256 RepID=A0A0G3HJU4_9CORY|nr:chromosome segregation protein SMC [Corynebacterium uterequi]AKK11392.1 condensin subunit Smc [Corynebacterium uterequi]
MHLKSLTLKGFKSFASATTLAFEPGICAVVGPNGSGKSNVVDALTWVMGEQGAKNLRGGKMEDVIFAGAGDRPPLGRAEVTLTIDNSDGKLPIDYTEVSITRRMYRDGASEYEINGSRARLMDIQELLSDSGIGREMHIIVGQNKLGDILASRPEERRAYIEEAAGVLKHRRRKEKAQRKLQSMQANLDRLQDLTDELGKQLTPLARQAEAARRAATVQATLRAARLALAGDRVVTLRTELADATRTADLHAARVTAATEALAEATHREQGYDARLGELSPQAEEAQQLWYRLSTLAERLAATIRVAEERSTAAAGITAYGGVDPDDLDARARLADEEHEELIAAAEEAVERLDSIRDKVDEHQEAFAAAEAEHLAALRALADRREGLVRLIAAEESLARQISAAEAEIARADDTLADTRARVRAARDDADTAATTLDRLRAERQPIEDAHAQATAESRAADARLDELRELQRQRERVVFSLRAKIDTLQATAPTSHAADILGADFAPIAAALSADASLGAAVAAALGPHAEALAGNVTEEIVEQLTDARRTVLVDHRDGAHDPWRITATLPAGARWLLDAIEVHASIAPAINRLLADVVLVDDVAAARAVVDADPRLRAVTPAGVLLGEGWVATGMGAVSTVEVTADIAEATELLTEATAAFDELSGTLEGARLAADDARVAAAAATAALRDHDTAIATWQRDHDRLLSQAEKAVAEHERHAQRAAEAEARLATLRSDHADARDRLAHVEHDDAPPEASTADRDRAAAALTQIKAMEMEAQLDLRSATERAGQHAGKAEALRRQAKQEREAKARHERAMVARRRAGELAAAVAEHAHALAHRTADALETATARRDELLRERTRAQEAASAVRHEVSALRRQLDELTAAAHAAEIARSQAQVRAEEAEAKTADELGIAIADLLREHSPGPDFDRDAERARFTQAQRDLRSLGKVNPLALEEYKALEERYSFLSTQLADVVKARADLTAVIEDVDEHILTLFTDAWRDVEAEFPTVFSILFPGGEGRLVLTDPEDMLTTGIEVEARPPGKKVKRLSLLSGGEKSLTALAMLVAIFRARPSPFYVMDEVEAALDDVNLRRLIALFEQLRADSQLIVITHQKPTMDVANVLYGVTMRGDGVTRVISQRMRPVSE